MQCGHCAMRSRGISFALLVKIHHHCCIAVARPPRDKEISGDSGTCGHSTPVRAERSAALLTRSSSEVFGYRHSTVWLDRATKACQGARAPRPGQPFWCLGERYQDWSSNTRPVNVTNLAESSCAEAMEKVHDQSSAGLDLTSRCFTALLQSALEVRQTEALP